MGRSCPTSFRACGLLRSAPCRRTCRRSIFDEHAVENLLVRLRGKENLDCAPDHGHPAAELGQVPPGRVVGEVLVARPYVQGMGSAPEHTSTAGLLIGPVAPRARARPS